MLGVDLPFPAKLKSLLAPGRSAVKGLTVIKSLLLSPQPAVLNEAICFPSASDPKASPVPGHLWTTGMQPLLCSDAGDLLRDLSKLQKLSLGTTPKTPEH